ncbi:MAG: hypothetical protein LBB85_08670 [Dysgonamonadaceae bacterium]|jgi:hypothetical protein|nr:hypothetical protein [Dysgonamonadaceae bacterium]
MNRNWHICWHLALGLAVVAGFGAVVMWLWNWLTPDIWGWPDISFWQASGLFVLCRILFGGFGVGERIFAFNGRHFKHRVQIREKWMKMTPEERKEFIHHHHFGHGHCFGRDFFTDKKSENKD